MSYAPAGPTILEFHHDPSFVRGLMGPLGSSKSTACVIEILRRSQMQAPSPDGIRRTRWAIIRNSYPELKTTTLKTWNEWCPSSYGKLTMDSPIRHHVVTDTMDMEVYFLALDREDDVRKLLSLEITGAWVNEAREVPKAIIDGLTGRVGRYPSRVQGGASWFGIMMDTNPPDDQHWWYKLAEEEPPDGWRFFKQPSGLSPEAENIQNLPPGYYERLIAGKDSDWVKVYCRGEYGFVTEGKAVYPMYRDRIHCDPEVRPVAGMPLLVGADFGLTPTAILGQKLVDGRWIIVDELVTDSCGIIRFAQLLSAYIATNYPDHIIDIGFGDPAGNQRSHSDERTAFEIMKAHTTWKWKPAPSNDPTMRREVVVNALNRLVDGNPGLAVAPKCKTLRKGFSGGYHYRYVKNGNNTLFHEAPTKNQYSHPHDALQYLLLGGGEHTVVMNQQNRAKRATPRIARDVDYNIFNRGN